MLSSKPSRYTSRLNPCEASRPAVTSRESPGRKNPKNNPVSTKMIAVSPTYPAHWMSAGRSRRREIRSDSVSISVCVGAQERGSEWLNEWLEVQRHRGSGQRHCRDDAAPLAGDTRP